MASQKVRRRRTENEFLQALDTGAPARTGLLVLIAAILAWLMHSPSLAQPMERVIVSLLFLLVAVAQIWMCHPNAWTRNTRMALMFGVILLQLALMKAMGFAGEHHIASISVVPVGGWSKREVFGLWQIGLPLTLAPLTLSVLLGRNHGLFAAVYGSLWAAAMSRSFDAKLLVASLIAGFASVFLTLEVCRRTQLVRAGLFIGLVSWMLALMFGWIGPFVLEEGVAIDWRLIATQSAVVIGGAIVTSALVGWLVPGLEHLFGVVTEMKWIELANLNHPLLKRMMLEAPGTYQHSLMVATLTETACEAIDANAPLGRVCAYFHDIGKLVKPEYFTENMRHGHNPHDDLAPTMSALIIVAHVKEGVDIALKEKLLPEIIDAIQQHHGTSLVFYFFKRAQTQLDEARKKLGADGYEEDLPEVREESFRYSGPRPQTRETAILSLADSIESAARSMERVTPARLEQLVDDIIEKRLLDGQLKECDLTMRELEVVAETFKNTLQSMMHSRVAYPQEEKRGSSADLRSPAAQ